MKYPQAMEQLKRMARTANELKRMAVDLDTDLGEDPLKLRVLNGEVIHVIVTISSRVDAMISRFPSGL